MEKLDKKDRFNLFWIIIVYLGIALTITHGEYIFGSKIDWGFQHFAFPDYFRKLFYKTGNVFPNFALNIGGGQNIYYFAYYGLLSPIVFISYLLPFVPMSFYIAFISLVLGIVSIWLFYKWIKGFNFDSDLCLVLSLIFACASPLLFQSHRHIMFVNYMPFLLLGLIGVRKYFSDGSKFLMMISIFLMIMTSYFYSVGGIICLTIYGIYEYLKRNEFNFQSFFKEGFLFAGYVIISVMMAGVILLPVMYALKNGRADSLSHISFLKAITPSLNFDFLLYKPYSVGLPVISLFSVIYLIFKRKDSFLGICLFLMIICPLVVYMLNGALYLDGKALIPFLPLYVLAIGLFLKDYLDGNVDFKYMFIIFALCTFLAYAKDYEYKIWFLFDGILFICLLFLFDNFKKKEIIFIPLMILCVSICLAINFSDNLILGKEFGKQNSLVLNKITSDLAKHDRGFYRIAVNLKDSNQTVNHIANINENVTTVYSSTYNTLYNRFYSDFNNNISARNMFITSEVKNTLFESMMGVKYLITDKAAPMGYKFYKRYGGYDVYINKNTLPIGFATNKVMSYKDYNLLRFPSDNFALISNVISNSGNYKYDIPFEKINFDLAKGESSGISISKYKDGYKVVSPFGGSLKIRLDESVKNKYYLLRFNMDKPQDCFFGDTNIRVNSIDNKLTCRQWKYFNGNYTFDYTLSSTKKFRYLYIYFSKGVHYIKSYELYSLNYDDFEHLFNNIDELKVSKALGDKISGSIDVSSDGYFKLSIPYDKGFNIFVDGKKVNYEKVNKAFIGFPISKGSHKIDISFLAPNVILGRIISLIGIVLFVFVNKKGKS
ncbi:MAG: YfhO family protein [Bacilli bacterium]|nr:YfhO family protein [Bacilli bacterium]